MGCSRNKATVMCFKEVWSWFLCEFYFKWSIVNLCGRLVIASAANFIWLEVCPFDGPLCLPDDFRKKLKLQSPRAWLGSSHASGFCLPLHLLFDCSPRDLLFARPWSSLSNPKNINSSRFLSGVHALCSLTSDHPGRLILVVGAFAACAGSSRSFLSRALVFF